MIDNEPLIPDDYGEVHTGNLQRCVLCGKYSDASLETCGVLLCGTHYDAWKLSPEVQPRGQPEGSRLADFVSRTQAEIKNGRRFALPG